MTTHTSSSSLPSFRPHCSARDPALTRLTKIPVLFPPTTVMSSARLARLCLGEVGGLEVGTLKGMGMRRQKQEASEGSGGKSIYLGSLEVGPGEETWGMWTRSGGKRSELRELQESQREGSLCSTGNTTVR